MITERAMLAAVHIRIWTAVKHDRKISRDVASQHGAHRDAGRYNKQLLRGEDKLDDLRTLAGQIRQYFYKITLPWSDEGFRLLPSNFYFDLMARRREFEASFEQGRMRRPAIRATIRSRSRHGREARMVSSPRRRMVPRTASTCPCGSERVVVSTSLATRTSSPASPRRTTSIKRGERWEILPSVS